MNVARLKILSPGQSEFITTMPAARIFPAISPTHGLTSQARTAPAPDQLIVEKDADLKVGSHAIFHQEKGVNLSALGTEGGPWGGWGSGTVMGQTSTIEFVMLLIDL